MKSDKKLILLTEKFPYGIGEQYLETEIQYLSKVFSEIHIYPFKKLGVARDLPLNAKVVDFNFKLELNVKEIFFRNFFVIFKIIISEITSWYSKKYNKTNRKYYFNRMIMNVYHGEIFYNHLKEQSNYKIYSYWFSNWGNIMSIVSDISNKRIEFITRVHGFDYDVNRHENGFIAFRNYAMKNVKTIYTVSDFARNRITQEYPNFKNIKTYRLGVSSEVGNPFIKNNELCIVSCSNVIALKRVCLIVNLLHRFKSNVKWIHFGDGELLEDVKIQCLTLPSNITVNFKGNVANQEVIDFYKTNKVDLFINLSEFEGIPVSIMEAISFGIPAVGCNICGVPEIVNDSTGILLDKDFDLSSEAEKIEKFLTQDYQVLNSFREGVKLFWQNNYNSKVNYKKFIDECLL